MREGGRASEDIPPGPRISVKALSKRNRGKIFPAPEEKTSTMPGAYSALGQPAQAGEASFAEAGQEGASFPSFPLRESSRPPPLPLPA
jgi:hypothetical protein